MESRNTAADWNKEKYTAEGGNNGGRHDPPDRAKEWLTPFFYDFQMPPKAAIMEVEMKVIIIGGVAGGASAAARLRRLDENAEIILLERSGYISYANCGLPYYIGGVIREKSALSVQTPESFGGRFRVDVRVKNEAVSIDPKEKTVRVRNLETGEEYTESYDKLLLSPGAKAIRPGLPGMDDKRIMTLRTVEDTLAIRDYLEEKKPKRAVVVGGGFIGLETAENLMGEGLEVSLIQMEDQVLPPLDYDMACQVHSFLRGKGLDLRLNRTVTGFIPKEDGLVVRMKRTEGQPGSQSGQMNQSGQPGTSEQTKAEEESIRADFVLMAAGVLPETGLAREAGLALGQKGAIVVDEHMRTSVPDIYAVGDAVEIRHFITGKKTLVALAGPANRQGRIAADNICGRDSVYQGAQGSSIIRLFEMTAASTGINEKQAKAMGLDYDKVITFSANHATYYPGAENLTIKTLFERSTGKLLGAQIVGFDGVDKRIDVLACAMRAGMTGEELADMDLAYAPPYSSAKDPVNMAGYVIGNVRSGLVEQYYWDEADGLSDRKDVILLDVRTEGEYQNGHIPGTVNIPLDELRNRLSELDREKILYVNCQSGLRSYLACRILSQNGFSCKNLAGGYRFYEYVKTDRTYDAAPAGPCGAKL